MQRHHRRESRLTSAEYLERHSITYYLRDVTTLLLRCRDERPLEFISDYFNEVLNGTHVLLRDYSFVSRCAHDRWAFVQSIREALADLDQELPASASVLTQLLRLVCPDFPLDVATDACRLCGDEQASHPLGRLLHTTCVRICFADFLRRAADVFRSCDPHGRNRVERSVVGLALRNSAQSLGSSSESCPPPGIFDELVSSPGGDVTLSEVLRLVVHSDHMRSLLQMPRSEEDGGAGGSTTLVASPPARDAANSPGTMCAAACAAATAAAGGLRRGAGGRAARERLQEAATAAAAVAAAGQAKAAAGRNRPSSSGPRRRGAGNSFAAASKLIQSAAPPSTPR